MAVDPPRGQLDARQVPRFAGPGTFARLPRRGDLVEDTDLGFRQVESAAVAELGVAAVAERIRERVADAPVYVSVDVDVLDPAHAPGTGTAEAGGLSSRELLAAAHVAYELLAILAHRPD